MIRIRRARRPALQIHEVFSSIKLAVFQASGDAHMKLHMVGTANHAEDVI